MRFLSSYFLRLALLVALLPVLIMGGALWTTYQTTAAQLRVEATNQISDEIASLVEIYVGGGPEALTRSINNRVKLTPETRARMHYGLMDTGGTRLAGNVSLAYTRNDNYAQFIDGTGSEFGPVIMRATPLRGGEVLHVVRSDRNRLDLLARLKTKFITLAFVTLALGLFAGFWTSRIFRRRIGALNKVCAQVGDGHLDARAAGADTRDEIGVLAGNVNNMLERISSLIKIRKNISDQVAHELRTPLSKLDGKLVEAAITCDDPRALDAARGEITGCISLLDSLLDVSALEAQSGDKTGFIQVDISALASDMSEFYQGLAEEKNMTLTRDIKERVTMMGDPMQLSRLLANLLDNAIKYTPRGGDIEISVSEGPRISVSDTGPGVPTHLRASIFTPFFRDPDKQNIGGHGLGLALCHAIAARHEMTLTVERANTTGGARFVLAPTPTS